MKRTTRVPWRKIAGGVPALALIVSGVVLAATGGGPRTGSIAASLPVVTVPPVPLDRSQAPTLPALPELPAPPEALPTDLGRPEVAAAPVLLDGHGIPAPALAAYRRAAQLVDAADPACHVDWALVGAIGQVESDHGRYAGNGIDRDGTVRPGIYGIPLDGSNATAVIHDTDGGRYDRDRTWDRAVGPMQFIPGTWRSVGLDANGDGRADPQNLTDAATAAAVYLCSGPGDLGTEGGARSAVLRYNHSDAYADRVLAIAAAYRGGYAVVPAADLSAAQRSAQPFLPSGGAPEGAAPATPGTPAAPARPVVPAPVPSGTATPTRPAPGGSHPAPRPTTGGPLTDTVGGLTGTVGGVVAGVGGVVGGLVGQPPTPQQPTPTPTPSATPSPSPTPGLLGLPSCPVGYLVSVDGRSCLRL